MRRTAVAALVGLVGVAACVARPPPKPPSPPSAPLHTADVADLVPAAGLSYLVLARPRELAARVDLVPAVSELVSEERLSAFAEKNALDLRGVEQLAFARYPETTLVVARAHVDAPRVEAAFTRHLREVSGRTIDRAGDAATQLVRTWGQAAANGADGREQLALLGNEAVALEQGKLDRVRVVELFAEQRLKKAAPALRTLLLARAAELVGDAPLRAFAPGPFEKEARALGGLLGASTAIAVAVRFPAPPSGNGARATALTPADVTIALLGAWGEDGPAAAQRLLVVFDTLADSSLGRLCGLDRPLAAATVRARPDAILLDLHVDALGVTRGLHAAIDAQVDEIMRYGGAPPKDPPPARLTPVP